MLRSDTTPRPPVSSNFNFFSFLGVFAFASGLALGLAGCDKQGGASASPAGSQGPGGFASSATGSPGDPANAGDPANPGDPAGGAAAGPPPCDPETDIQPTAFFGQRILITLPKGVELTERNPFFASATTGGQASSCGTPIAFAAVGYLRSTASLPEIRKHVMMLRGFRPEELTFSDEKSLGDTTIATYTATSEPPLRGLIFFKRAPGWYYFSLLEASDGDFAGLEAVFRASFASLLIRPVRDGA